jgi:hypothetical protein
LDASPIQPAETQTSTSRLRDAPKLTAERVLRLHVATTLAPNDKGPLSKAFRTQKLNPDDPWDWVSMTFRLALERFGGRGRGRPKEDDEEILQWERMTQSIAARPGFNGLLSVPRVAKMIYLLQQKNGFKPRTERTIVNKLRAAHKRQKLTVEPPN